MTVVILIWWKNKLQDQIFKMEYNLKLQNGNKVNSLENSCIMCIVIRL